MYIGRGEGGGPTDIQTLNFFSNCLKSFDTFFSNNLEIQHFFCWLRAKISNSQKHHIQSPQGLKLTDVKEFCQKLQLLDGEIGLIQGYVCF